MFAYYCEGDPVNLADPNGRDAACRSGLHDEEWLRANTLYGESSPEAEKARLGWLYPEETAVLTGKSDIYKGVPIQRGDFNDGRSYTFFEIHLDNITSEIKYYNFAEYVI